MRMPTTEWAGFRKRRWRNVGQFGGEFLEQWIIMWRCVERILGQFAE